MGWRIALLADVLIGPHGAGLAWGAFLAKGRILVELLPYKVWLDEQLCRGADMDSTPMYYYGGLSLMAGLHHVRIVGTPCDGQATYPSLFEELSSWNNARIRVNT